jgi:ABC-2 type transport system permease protein
VLTVASFVPVTSTVTMPARLFAGSVPWWEVAVSLGLALAFAALAIGVAARIYRTSVLRTGARVSLRASLTGSRQAPAPVPAGVA